MNLIKWIIMPLLVAIFLIWSAAFSLSENQLHVFFLDVGQGDAIFIRTPSHQNILIDGGPSPIDISYQLGTLLPYWDRRIDLMILTHSHNDHIEGLIEILRRYQVKRILVPLIEINSAVSAELHKLVAQNEIEVVTAFAGLKIYLGEDILLYVMHPPADYLSNTSSDADNNGIVIKLSYHEISFLFTADIRIEAEQNMLARGCDLQSTVFKVAHHGSSTSSCSRFISSIDPQVAIISCGHENTFGHPHSEVLERLSSKNIYRTDIHGTIELITDGTKLWVRTHK